MKATHWAVAIFLLAFTTPAAATEPAAKSEKKPVVTCDEIVKVYKDSHSVDTTAQALFVEESRIAQCLKAAGINEPLEENR